MPGANENALVRKIAPGDKFTGFSVGEEQFNALKIFLRKRALQYQEQKLAVTYGVFQTGSEKLLAYITLVCGEIFAENNHLIDNVQYNYRSYPAVKIARLAVDSKFRKRGLGEQLVQLALGKAKIEIAEEVGCRFVVVDSKKAAVGFYEKCGFTMLGTAENRARDEPVMFVDLYKT